MGALSDKASDVTDTQTDLALDALERALWARPARDGLVHHGDRDVQYLSIRYSERLAAARIEGSIGRVGDSYDNALAESVIGLYKTEVIRPGGPWKGLEGVELATLDWVHWFNNTRLLEPIGYVPPRGVRTGIVPTSSYPKPGSVTQALESPMKSARFRLRYCPLRARINGPRRTNDPDDLHKLLTR